MDMQDLRALCTRMKLLQEQKEKAEEALSALNADYNDLRLYKIPEMMEALGLKNATFEGMGRVQLASDLYASTRTGQKEAAMTWLRDCGYADMITETYNASSIKGLFRRMIAEGTEIPEEIFNVSPFVRASIVN